MLCGEIARATRAKERLERELADSIALGKQLRDSFNREVASGSKFFKSESGKIYLECVKADFKEDFEKSAEFEMVALAKAEDVYDQTIRECRATLSSSGQFPREDFMFLDPSVANLLEPEEAGVVIPQNEEVNAIVVPANDSANVGV
ncbi:UNVERIFIED_CONTAM: hypothetical protein Sradi_2058000 [Sesamum radiatum]|uniref:Uncharacterized protein n=1 Tax=Sesamum radiatum TaxID=300843 RepID=A0AAW2THV0_SESRA